MIMINVEYFLLKHVLSKFTEEEGELIPHIHMHALFFETGLKCHSCDICSDQMKAHVSKPRTESSVTMSLQYPIYVLFLLNKRYVYMVTHMKCTLSVERKA